jgi:hypothetical protein
MECSNSLTCSAVAVGVTTVGGCIFKRDFFHLCTVGGMERSAEKQRVKYVSKRRWFVKRVILFIWPPSPVCACFIDLHLLFEDKLRGGCADEKKGRMAPNSNGTNAERGKALGEFWYRINRNTLQHCVR